MKTVITVCLAAVMLAGCGSKSGTNEAVKTPSGNTTSTVKPLINPAHGAPGHDCAVPVGAQLTQKEPAQPQVQNNGTVQTEVQSLPEKFSGPKVLNPAHGQPGHRCDIAVGAPLN